MSELVALTPEEVRDFLDSAQEWGAIEITFADGQCLRVDADDPLPIVLVKEETAIGRREPLQRAWRLAAREHRKLCAKTPTG